MNQLLPPLTTGLLSSFGLDDLEPDTFEALYDRYAGVVFSLALRMVGDRPLAEEILEEVFFRVWHHGETIRGTVLAWLTEMTRALAIEAVFDRPAAGPAKTDPAIGLEALEPLAGPRIRETRRAITAALAALPPEQRRTIERAYFEGLTEEELAQSLGAQRERIRSWLRNAIRMIGESSRSPGL